MARGVEDRETRRIIVGSFCDAVSCASSGVVLLHSGDFAASRTPYTKLHQYFRIENRLLLPTWV
jgi:hypothetical protein